MLKTKSIPIPIPASSTTQTISLPSPKKLNRISSSGNIANKKVDRNSLQVSNEMFDPNNASPNTEFMQLLKHRMNVYYEHEVCMFS